MAEKAEGGVPAGAGGAPAPDEFRRFLVGLATDPAQLGRFIKDPLGTMAEAGLSPQDQATLQSADPGAIHARLTGAPTPGTPVTVLVVNVGEGAPGAETLHVTPAAQIVAPQIIHPQILPQQVIHPQIWPQQVIHPQIWPQQIIHPQIWPQQIIHPQIWPQQIIHPQIWPQQVIHPQILPQQVIHPQILPQQVIHPQILPQQVIHPQIWPQQIIHPQIWPQQIIHPQVLPQTGQQQ